MDGEIGLDFYDLIDKPSASDYGTKDIRGTNSDRSSWTVRIFGSLTGGKYDPPTATTWPTTTSTVVAMPSTTVGRNWEDYIRSRD